MKTKLSLPTTANWYLLPYCILYLVLYDPIDIKGQTAFGTENLIVVGGQAPHASIPADLDGDGDMDVISTFTDSNKVVWYENLNGLGSFGDPRLISDQLNLCYAVAAADLDGDGDLDITAASHLNDHRIVWFENVNGMGNFGSGQFISTQIIGIYYIYTADLDGDGDQDVLAAAYNDNNRIVWFKNEDGLGSFGAPQVINSQQITGKSNVQTADLDGDGDLDIISSAIVTSNHRIALYMNEDGNGNFGAAQVIHTQGLAEDHVRTADMDSDGDLDILFIETTNDRVAWLENEDGLGTFGSQPFILNQISTITNCQAADVDGDGDMDILVAQGLLDKVYWYMNQDGQGTFVVQNIISDQEDGLKSLEVADMDGDGDLDVLTASENNDKVAWHNNTDGLGTFGQPVWISKQARGIRALVAADIDGDGDMDLISASETDDKIAWYENEDGLGTFTKQHILTTQADGARSVRVADVDGDGDLDILSASPGDERLLWYENLDGQANFGEPILIWKQASGGAKDLFPADFDGDGDLDVIATKPSSSSDKVPWYENEDPFTAYWEDHPFTILSSSMDVSLVFPADIDNDGDMDVYLAAGSSLYWYENTDGLGNAWSVNYFTGTNGETLHPADIDGDGDMDMVTSLNSGDQVGWVENLDGLGSYNGAYHLISTEADCPKNAIAADMDGDGDLDVLSASACDDKIAWYDNLDGKGNFGPQQVISTSALSPNAVITADLDGDGDMDVVYTSTNHSKIAWFRNLSQGPAISGRCFFDKNENKVKDADETGLLNNIVKVQPEAVTNFTDATGKFKFFVENGNYTVAAFPGPNWQLTTDSASYTVTFQDAPVKNLDFGFVPVQDISAVKIGQTSSPTRCGFQVPYWLDFENSGTTAASGFISFTPDPLTGLIEAVPAPDSIEGNTYFWRFNDLAPSYHNTVALRLQMPGVNNLGDTVAFHAAAVIELSPGDFQPSTTSLLSSVINCAYDPNDKLVRPEGVQEERYTLFGEELEFTVRFQNTGTDTAFNIRITDQLDGQLDWNSFRPIAASHPFDANLDGGGLVEFLFSNIMLPDSNINEAASHGFVKYRILPLANLPEYTEIHNTADIFFDFNPPIQTNTTLNTLVSEIPSDPNSTNAPAGVDIVHITPNPFHDYVVFEIGKMQNQGTLSLFVYDTYGRLLEQYQVVPPTSLVVDLSSQPPGTYFYELRNGPSTVINRGQLVKL